MQGKKVFIGVLLVIAGILRAYSQNLVALDQHLEKLQKSDKLADWIYARLEYCIEKPAERLNFLMLTENNSWRKPKNADEHEAWLNLLLNQGYYQLYTGNVLSSIEQYENAYAYYLKHRVKNLDLVEYVLKPLGNNYTRLGDYSRALYIHEKSLTLSIAAKDSLAVAATYSNMAIAYKSVGQLKEAEKSCRSGFNYLKETSALYGLLRSTLADIQFERGDLKEASASINTAINILSKHKETPESSYWLLSAYTLAGNIVQLQREPGGALPFYKKALSLIDKEFQGNRIREKANLMNLSAEVYLKEKKAAAALQMFNKSLQLLLPKVKDQAFIPNEALYGENRLYDALEGKGKALLLLGRTQEALTYFLLALETGERSRNEYVNNRDRVYYQRQAKTLAELAIHSAFSIWTKAHSDDLALKILSIAERSKARTLQDQIQKNRQYAARNSKDPLLVQKAALESAIAYYEREEIVGGQKAPSKNKQEAEYKLALLDKQIRKKYPFWEKDVLLSASVNSGSLKILTASANIVEFFLGETDLYSIFIQNGKVSISRTPNAGGLKNKIQSYVQTYFQKGPAAMVNSPKRFFESSHSLFQILFDDFARQSAGKNLIIIPDDVLGYLPFESLVSSRSYVPSITQWKYLINQSCLSYAYSIASLSSSFPRATVNPQKFTGFFITSEGKDTPIPSVAAEAKAIEGLVRGNFLIDDKATLAEFRQSLSRSAVLHMSTHSYMYGEQAEPTLQLADGRFFLLELSAQKQVPQLVVLSACRTADGLLAKGEGILSLSRGFIAAGTQGIVAGLWNVNDQSGSELIGNFYSNLQAGETTSTALHKAKLSWLGKKHDNQALLLPYYWSSLIYVGQEQSVDIEKPSHIVSYLVFAIAIVLISAISLWLNYRRKTIRKY